MIDQPIRNRQAERREATRLEILDAAWEIARQRSLAEVTLREIAERIGMRPPSLYTHFDSKSAVIDAMFGTAWAEYLRSVTELHGDLPAEPRTALHVLARHFFDFAVADLARFQLMNQRTLPDFSPSADSYAPAVEVLERLTSTLVSIGLPDEGDRDLYVALIGGLVDAQLANDPGGQRWSRLLPRAIDMFADEVGLPQIPGTPRSPRTRARSAR